MCGEENTRNVACVEVNIGNVRLCLPDAETLDNIAGVYIVCTRILWWSRVGSSSRSSSGQRVKTDPDNLTHKAKSEHDENNHTFRML